MERIKPRLYNYLPKSKLTSLGVKQRQHLVAPVMKYLAGLEPDDERNLILDGTGPRLTIHLPYLCGLNEEIQKFNKVYAFSGGVAAYCVYQAQRLGYVKQLPSYYFKSADAMARSAHRLSLMDKILLILRLHKRQAVYKNLPYMTFFRDLIDDKFFHLTLNEVTPELIPLIAFPNQIRPVAVTVENGFDRNSLTMEQIMAVSMKIPHIYSGNSGVKLPEHLTDAYDATYTGGYWSVRSRLSEIKNTVTLSMSDKGLSEQACKINILNGRRAKNSIAIDIAALLLNLPNSRYRYDLTLAYN